MVIVRCEEFSDWLTQNFSNSGMGYWFLSCVTCVMNWHEIPFSKQYRHATNHFHLYVTNCYILSAQPLTAYPCECEHLLEDSIYTYCNIWPNQHRSNKPIFDIVSDTFTLSCEKVLEK